MILYRTDDREPWRVEPGFLLKNGMKLEAAKEQIVEWLSTDVLYAKIANHMANAKDYAISADKNPGDPGGYQKKFCYEVDFNEDVQQYEFTADTLGIAPKEKDKAHCAVYMDEPTLEDAKVVGFWVDVNGRENEFTFLTEIPSKYIVRYAVPTPAQGFVNFLPMRPRNVYLGPKGGELGVAALRGRFAAQNSPAPPPPLQPLQKNPALAKKALAAFQDAKPDAPAEPVFPPIKKLNPALLGKFQGK